MPEKKESSWKSLRSRLELPGGDLLAPPWQSFMAYAGVGLFFLIFLPFGFQLIQIVVVKQPVLSEIRNIRIGRSMFVPYGIYAGMGFASVCFMLCLCWQKWRLAADGWVLGLLERFVCCSCPRGKTEGDEQPREWPRRGRLCIFVVFVTLMPFCAWFSSLRWWELAAGRFQECKSVCSYAHNEDKLLCFTVGMPEVSQTKASHSDMPSPEPEIRDHCWELLEEAADYNSTYINAMVKDKRSFLMFEAVLRRHYSVSILDIYGSLLGCIIIVVVVTAKIALRQKASALVKVKFQWVRDHMADNCDELRKYRRLFKAMCLWGGTQDSWVLRYLMEIEKELKKLKKQEKTSEETASGAEDDLEQLANDAKQEVIDFKNEGGVGTCSGKSEIKSAETSEQKGKKKQGGFEQDKAPQAVRLQVTNEREDEKRLGSEIKIAEIGERKGIKKQNGSDQDKVNNQINKQITSAKAGGDMSIEEHFNEKAERNKACGRALKRCQDDIFNDHEPICSKVVEDTRAVAMTLIFALVDATIPCCARWWRSDGEQPFLGYEEIAQIVLFNVIVTFVSDVSMFAFLVDTQCRHKAQLEQVICFDCLWRFPEEDNLHSVTRDSDALLDVADHREYQGGDFTEGMDGARLRQLRRWFHLRQYVQINSVDDRVSMEVAITIGLMMLVPRFTIFAVNLLVLDSPFWSQQAVNLQLAWAMVCTLGVIIQALLVTLNLNDFFDRHLQNLRKLLEETKLKKSFENSGKGEDEIELENNPFVTAVKTVRDTVDKSNAPSTVFGITVNRKFIAGYVAVTVGTCAPQGWVILKNFLDDMTTTIL